ncbi:MAG: TM1802 family CRISPR-associated protein, partial [Caldisericum exile]
MLSAVKEIGRFVSKPTVKIDGKIILIVLGSNLSFKAIELEDFIAEKIEDKYLYKPGESKGNRPSLFAPINLKEPEKTFQKIVTWFKNAEKTSNLGPEDLNKIRKINNVLQQEKSKILSSIVDQVKQLPKKSTKFLSVRINDKYLGDFRLFREIFNLNISQRIGRSSSKDRTCSICGEVKDTVSARTHVYQFDTDDKPGFITEFNKKNYWKNIPVCQECRDLLQKGR